MFSLATPSVRSRVVVVITYCGGAIRLIYRERREGGRENEQSLVVSLSLVDIYVVLWVAIAQLTTFNGMSSVEWASPAFSAALTASIPS